jgi:membrane-associated phospholipid phosphatase
MLRFVRREFLNVLFSTFALSSLLQAQTTIQNATSASSGNASNTIASSGASATGKDKAKDKAEDSVHTYELQPGEDPQNRLVSPFLKHIVSDQKEFWTMPAHLQVKDLKWIVPSAGVLAAFIASDSWWSKQVPASHISTSKTVSDYIAYSFIGLGGSSFLLGHIKHDDHLSETGLLAAEAAIDSTAVAYAFKATTQRERPYQGNGSGDFFTGGYSFPSEHSAIAWSVASVWAHEYPGWLSQIGAYGLATTVAATRVTAKQHFPSDVLIGSALGWYFGRQVYRAHHDPELGGSGWGPVFEEKTGETPRNPDYMASPYVPIDSWIYPALERLIALGYTRSNMLGMRPWTRMACARLVEEAGEKLQNDEAENTEPGKIYRTLAQEFATETARLDGAPNVGARLDSVYTRAMGISGTPLRDGYHFGQTIINDYGRPYWEGFNNVTGVTADAEVGPVAFNFQGEYQHAPAMPSYSPQVLAATAAADASPPLANGTAELNSFQLLNSTVSLNVNNVQLSFGEQSQWLGPGESGPLLMSNNAAPFPTLKLDTVSPYHVPGFSRLFGPLRTEFYIGQLSGHHWEHCVVSTCQSYPGYPNIVGPSITPQPFIQGGKISFQPTPDLEIGMQTMAMFGGPGLPVTFGNFFATYYVHTPNLAKNPGKRASAADLTYRIPGIRNWLTFYLDSMTWDEISPIGSTRANVNPGIYMPRLPGLPKLQLRAEGFNVSRTAHSGPQPFAPGWVYFNGDRYLNGYTNDGNLLGSWIGRAGRGVQAWVSYSASPRNQVQFGYRLQTVASNFVCIQPAEPNCAAPPGGFATPGGGRLADYSVQGEFLLGQSFSVSGLVQYEQWRFPVLNLAKESDITASLQLTFYPRWKVR